MEVVNTLEAITLNSNCSILGYQTNGDIVSSLVFVRFKVCNFLLIFSCSFSSNLVFNLVTLHINLFMANATKQLRGRTGLWRPLRGLLKKIEAELMKAMIKNLEEKTKALQWRGEQSRDRILWALEDHKCAEKLLPTLQAYTLSLEQNTYKVWH